MNIYGPEPAAPALWLLDWIRLLKRTEYDCLTTENGKHNLAGYVQNIRLNLFLKTSGNTSEKVRVRNDQRHFNILLETVSNDFTQRADICLLYKNEKMVPYQTTMLDSYFYSY